MKRKIGYFCCAIIMMIILSSCGMDAPKGESSDGDVASVDRSVENVSGSDDDVISPKDAAPDDPIRTVEELIQGKWEYYVPDTGFKEVRTFDNGKTSLELTVREYDYEGTSEGSYVVTDNHIIVSINGDKEYIDYSLKDDKIALSFLVSTGTETGKTHTYFQTEKGELREDYYSGLKEQKVIADEDFALNDNDENANYDPDDAHSNADTQKYNTSASSGDKNALERAKQYLEYTAFSYSGLIEQLEYEGYSHSEATYGADNCGADWNGQAEKKAKQYIDYSAFSYSGLIEQLEYEGYSHSEAMYGADNCGADWNEQAEKKARQYLEYSSFSKDGLIEQLEFEGFTRTQAEYGANKAY